MKEPTHLQEIGRELLAEFPQLKINPNPADLEFFGRVHRVRDREMIENVNIISSPLGHYEINVAVSDGITRERIKGLLTRKGFPEGVRGRAFTDPDSVSEVKYVYTNHGCSNRYHLKFMNVLL